MAKAMSVFYERKEKGFEGMFEGSYGGRETKAKNSDHFFFFQPGKVCVGQAEHTLVDLLVVLTEVGRALGDLRLGIHELDRVAGDDHVADDRVLQVHEHLAGVGDVVVVDDVGKHIDRRNRDTGRIDDGHAIGDGVLGAPLLDLGLERGVVLAAVDVGVKARILEQVGAVERLGAQEREELVVAAADDEASVAGLEGVIREGGGVAVADQLGLLAGGEEALPADLKAGDDGVDERDVHALAAAGDGAGVERHEDADGEVHAAEHVAHGIADTQRLAAGLAGDAHEAGGGLRDDVIAGALVLRAVAAEAGDSGVDDLVVDFLEHVIADAQLVHDAGAVVLDDDVGLLDHLEEELFALLGLQVQGDALLAAVDVGIVHAVVVLLRAHGAGIVALARHLDLDDVGAVVGQHHFIVAGTGYLRIV